MTTPLDTTTDADKALKDRHRAMWALGSYPTVAAEIVRDLGAVLIDACGVAPGQRVLDVAAGTGNAAIAAARAGATVVASDLTPELVEVGRALSAQAGVPIDWGQADAEALPYDDASFDVVMSCIGVMFAPHHQRSADELVRVCRPGGTIGVLSWTPRGFIGQLFATMRPYVAPPPPGVQPAPLWGDEDHVRELFGDRVHDVAVRRQTLPVDRFATGEQFRDYFQAHYGPVIAAYRQLADDPERTAALDADLRDLGDRGRADGTGTAWEYLVFTARRN